MKPTFRTARSSLRPHTRRLPKHVIDARLLEHLQASKPPADPDLHALFTLIWSRANDALWTVSELHRNSLIGDGINRRQLGHALAALVDQAGGHCGVWRLVRHRSDKDGRIWQLVAR